MATEQAGHDGDRSREDIDWANYVPPEEPIEDQFTPLAGAARGGGGDGPEAGPFWEAIHTIDDWFYLPPVNFDTLEEYLKHHRADMIWPYVLEVSGTPAFGLFTSNERAIRACFHFGLNGKEGLAGGFKLPRGDLLRLLCLHPEGHDKVIFNTAGPDLGAMNDLKYLVFNENFRGTPVHDECLMHLGMAILEDGRPELVRYLYDRVAQEEAWFLWRNPDGSPKILEHEPGNFLACFTGFGAAGRAAYRLQLPVEQTSQLMVRVQPSVVVALVRGSEGASKLTGIHFNAVEAGFAWGPNWMAAMFPDT